MKQKEPTNNDFYKKVITDLIPFGFIRPNRESISFMVENNSDDVVVDYNYMSTGLHYKKNEVNKEDIEEAGFKWCETWNYNG